MVKVENVHKYFGPLHVLKGVHLEVEPQEVVVLLGASGSGKSTLLRCLNFLEIADEGKIWLDGQFIDPVKTDLNRVRTDIGMVFQHFNLFPHMSVLENVIEAPVHVKKVPREEARENALSLLRKVGLEDKKDVYPDALS